jgi:predicted TPR repeat methyltransferase
MTKPSASAAKASRDPVLALQLAGAVKQAKALRAAGKIGEAAALCQTILKADPRHVETLHLIGALALQTDAFDIAITSFNRALAEKPRSPAILFDLAQALAAAGKPAGAISAFRKALTLRPNDVAAYLGLGDAQLDMGNRTDALKSYRKARALDPGNRLAAHMIAVLSGEDSAASADYVSTLFDAYAPTFETHLAKTLGYNLPERLLEALSPFLPQSGRFASVLDLGCGTGLVGAVFKDAAEAIDGVDLAPAMVEAAKSKQIYRSLRVGDLAGTMRADPAFAGPYQLVIAADVFIYIAALETVFSAVRQRLPAGGLFAFSVEETDQGPVDIRSSGRIAHAKGHILELARTHGFVLRGDRALAIRTERSRPIDGRIFILQVEQ